MWGQKYKGSGEGATSAARPPSQLQVFSDPPELTPAWSPRGWYPVYAENLAQGKVSSQDQPALLRLPPLARKTAVWLAIL